MSTASYFLAADSGGSKTVLLLLNSQGEILAENRCTGVASLQPGTLPVARPLGDALAHWPCARITHGYFSLGGPNVAEVQAALAAILPQAQITVDREANGNLVLAAGTHFGCDAALLIGTGSTAVGMVKGERRYAGGWGPLLDDAGSGGKLGLEALKLYLLHLDSRIGAGKIASLFTELERGLNPAEFEDRMMIKTRANNLSRAELAALAPRIARLAENDPCAALLLETTTREIAALACAVTPETAACGILMLGGLFRLGADFRNRCETAIRRLRPLAHCHFPEHFELVRGAALMVLQQAKIPLDSKQIQHILQG